MQLTRLRIVGFKTFVEPSDFLIEPGLTGIVGPNGCGKSNLVEALRWAMGESSHKSLRASGMDEVIFGGSGGRPARNHAEVTVTLDNSRRTAPAAFNETDILEISRRIAREAGSTYRINGREVRARDVQLLFADAATGARSAAMVRQGQISEIIAAKPQARRRILEDAAGIAGLHARRHETELRLKAAEDNLVRVEDVLGEIGAQIESLRKQSRQAARYRSVSAEIRRLEAVLHIIAHSEARAQVAQAEAMAREGLDSVAELTVSQTQAARAQAVAAHALPGLRDALAAAAATHQRLTLARGELDAQERRAQERASELERRASELQRDQDRQRALLADARATIARLSEEAESLAESAEDEGEARNFAQARLDSSEAALSEAEATLNVLQVQVSDLNARRAALERGAREERERAMRQKAEREKLEREAAALQDASDQNQLDLLRAELEHFTEAMDFAEEHAGGAREALARAREAEAAARGPLAEAERKAQRLDAEMRTLAKLFAPTTGDLWPPVLDQIDVQRGYEAALGAALGEDLDASSNPSAPAHWAASEPSEDDPTLPEGVVPLADFVEAPPALRRRLRQIGIVARDTGDGIRTLLRVGQRLVSREGDLWRWDGFTAAAEAPSPAARRLAEKNRLGELEREAASAREAADALRRRTETLQGAARLAGEQEAQALEAVRQARRALDGARERMAAAERKEAEAGARRSALAEALARVAAGVVECETRARQADENLAAMAPAPELDARLAQARAQVAQCRAEAIEARGALQGLVREAEIAARRRTAIAAEISNWRGRAEQADLATRDISERLEEAHGELEALRDAPDTFVLRRRALIAQIEEADAGRREAADRLAEAETALAATERDARRELERLSAAREALAAAKARHEALTLRAEEIRQAISDTLETDPAGLYALAGLEPGGALPSAAESESRLSVLKLDRERLGAVNLRAEEELRDIVEKRDALVGERDDLVEAIKRLRQALSSLNREGRERLLAAFAVVNEQFQRLFRTLFGGGTAELKLVDSDDPLEAGLDILACPPGKKPQTMTLLSGGEQALTATALIFAVFLTNPSPICVLDEVDAPLDDANVERYCDLLDEMARTTSTRFLVITHNPITMARMNRLFGVTMAERGVSQLVSVDLGVAERLLEAI